MSSPKESRTQSVGHQHWHCLFIVIVLPLPSCALW